MAGLSGGSDVCEDEEVGLVGEWFSYIEAVASGNNKIASCDCQVKRLNKS